MLYILYINTVPVSGVTESLSNQLWVEIGNIMKFNSRLRKYIRSSVICSAILMAVLYLTCVLILFRSVSYIFCTSY